MDPRKDAMWQVAGGMMAVAYLTPGIEVHNFL
jgi:hypothetical protein